MTTTELTSLIIEDIIAEVPIQMDGDEQGIREEMSALIYEHIERYRQQMVDKACKWLVEQFYYSNLMEGWKKIPELEKEFEAMLNENK